MKKLDILDSGFIRLVDMMGNDDRVLDAARVSTGASSKGKKEDAGLINYLMENRHHTPFEKIVFEFHIKCPIFIARQWFRHRIGSFNEMSSRYREFEFEVYMPTTWRGPGTTNHQGSISGVFDKDEELELKYILLKQYTSAQESYRKLLEKGVAKELARLIIPMAQYTEFYWTVNMRSLMNFLSLRDDDHAQFEIREYAKGIKRMIESTNKIPMTLKAFERFGYSGLKDSLCKCHGS